MHKQVLSVQIANTFCIYSCITKDFNPRHLISLQYTKHVVWQCEQLDYLRIENLINIIILIWIISELSKRYRKFTSSLIPLLLVTPPLYSFFSSPCICRPLPNPLLLCASHKKTKNLRKRYQYRVFFAIIDILYVPLFI